MEADTIHELTAAYALDAAGASRPDPRAGARGAAERRAAAAGVALVDGGRGGRRGLRRDRARDLGRHALALTRPRAVGEGAAGRRSLDPERPRRTQLRPERLAWNAG